MKPHPTHRRAFQILFVVTLLTASGNTALQAVLALIGREVGVRDTLIVGVFSASALGWAVVSPIWARESDRRGRKPLILLGVAGFSLSMLCFALVVAAGERRLAGAGVIFVAMLLARSIYGLVGSAATPAAQAYVADRTKGHQRVQALATLASAVGLGTVIGPTLAPFLVLPGLRLAGPMAVFCLAGLILLAVVWRALPHGDYPGGPAGPRPTHAVRPKGIWRDSRVAPFVGYGFLLASAQAINTQALAFTVIDTLHMSAGRAETFVGIAMLAGAMATLLGQWGLIPLLRMTPRALLRSGAALAALGNLIMAFAPDYYTVVVAYGVTTLGYGLGRPGFTAGASLAASADEQGAIAGMIGSLNGACYVVSPLIGMALYEAFHPAPFLLNAAMLAGLGVAALMVPALSRPAAHGLSVERDEPAETTQTPP